MTALLSGRTGAEHADQDLPNTPKEVTPMHGQKDRCQTCLSQIRPADKPADTDCRDPDAEWNNDTCSGWTPVDHQTLALRVAELYNLVGIAWDVVMVVLDNSSKLPEVKI